VVVVVVVVAIVIVMVLSHIIVREFKPVNNENKVRSIKENTKNNLPGAQTMKNIVWSHFVPLVSLE
jgi:hypothetical protein